MGDCLIARFNDYQYFAPTLILLKTRRTISFLDYLVVPRQKAWYNIIVIVSLGFSPILFLTSLERTLIINFRKSRHSISSPTFPTFSIFPSFAATRGLISAP